MKTNLTYKELEATTYMRLLEMKLEQQTVRLNDVGLTMQFFKDFQLYGLNEAIAYAKGYEQQGYYKPGTAVMLEGLKNQFIEELTNPLGNAMQSDGSYLITEELLERLDNVFIKLNPRLWIREQGDNYGIQIATKFAEVANIPIEVASFYVYNYFVPEKITDELQNQIAYLIDEGKIIKAF